MKKIFCLITLMLGVATAAFSQAKKPTLMALPSDLWCNQNGFVKHIDIDGETTSTPDYGKAFITSTDLHIVIATLEDIMAKRGFTMKNAEAIMKSINNTTAENNVMQSKTSGASISESSYDRLRRRAKADIILDITWSVNTNGPEKSLTCDIKGLDAYTNKTIATGKGTGTPTFSAELPVLLEEAVEDYMENFCSELQAYFDDMQQNGREVTLDINIFDNGSGLDFETEYGGEELSDIIDNWMAENTVQHRFSKADASEDFVQYEQVRIPLYKANGMAQDTEGFAKELRKFLAAPPYNITSKVVMKGLGKCQLILGEK